MGRFFSSPLPPLNANAVGCPSLCFTTERDDLFPIELVPFFSPRTNSPTKRYLAVPGSVNSSPSFFSSVSPVELEEDSTYGDKRKTRGDGERRKGDFRSANIVSLLMNFSVR